MRGAVALIELRGRKQLETSIGLNMFMQFRTQIVSYLLSTCLTI
jgi:hypothetical protein